MRARCGLGECVRRVAQAPGRGEAAAGVQPTEGEQPGRRAQRSPHPPLVETRKKHREPLGMNFAGFAKLSLFNSINRLGPCWTPKIALGPIPDARGRTVGQKRAVNLTDPNPLRPRGPRPGSCCPQHGNRRRALAGVPALEQNSNSKLCLSTGHGPTVEIMP